MLYDPSQRSPQEVGRCCGEALARWRQAQPASGHALGHIVLVLGGCKTTPATGSTAIALQPGEWGVDVVETQDPDQFLADLNWPAMIADKPPDQIFQVEVKIAP